MKISFIAELCEEIGNYSCNICGTLQMFFVHLKSNMSCLRIWKKPYQCQFIEQNSAKESAFNTAFNDMIT